MTTKEKDRDLSARPAPWARACPSVTPPTGYEFRLLRDHIHDYCGIYFDDSKSAVLANRLSFRLRLLGMSTHSEYYNYLRYSPRAAEEMDDLVPHLTNNETYFFREMGQLSAFTGPVLEEIGAKARARGGPVRVLSCGCSSGEEAFTIVMLLDELGRGRGASDVRIDGVDIDRKVLEKAVSGSYTSYSLRATERSRIERYFAKDGERYTLSDGIRRRVGFTRGNILDPEALRPFRGADAIFCRNVLIYFSDDAIRRAAELFHDTLADGGYLFLGHSESLSRITDVFQARRFPNAIIYRKGAR